MTLERYYKVGLFAPLFFNLAIGSVLIAAASFAGMGGVFLLVVGSIFVAGTVPLGLPYIVFCLGYWLFLSGPDDREGLRSRFWQAPLHFCWFLVPWWVVGGLLSGEWHFWWDSPTLFVVMGGVLGIGYMYVGLIERASGKFVNEP